MRLCPTVTLLKKRNSFAHFFLDFAEIVKILTLHIKTLVVVSGIR